MDRGMTERAFKGVPIVMLLVGILTFLGSLFVAYMTYQFLQRIREFSIATSSPAAAIDPFGIFLRTTWSTLLVGAVILLFSIIASVAFVKRLSWRRNAAILFWITFCILLNFLYIQSVISDDFELWMLLPWLLILGTSAFYIWFLAFNKDVKTLFQPKPAASPLEAA
jgi:hypothetical protein